MSQIFFISGCLLAAAGVALGAFGAHALQSRLSLERQGTFETAVRYQMYHAFGLLAVSLTLWHWSASAWPVVAGWFFLAGILLFSGSLYLLVATDRRWLGAITPLGGVAFIAGWICLTLTIF